MYIQNIQLYNVCLFPLITDPPRPQSNETRRGPITRTNPGEACQLKMLTIPHETPRETQAQQSPSMLATDQRIEDKFR